MKYWKRITDMPDVLTVSAYDRKRALDPRQREEKSEARLVCDVSCRSAAAIISFSRFSRAEQRARARFIFNSRQRTKTHNKNETR